MEEDLISNDPTVANQMVTYSVKGRLQSRSPGASTPDNNPRQLTLSFMVDGYIEKHSDQSTNTYHIDLTTTPQIFRQHGEDMF